MIAFMQFNNWQRVVMLASTDEIYFDSRLGLAKQLEAASITVLTPVAFEPGNINEATLSHIRRSGTRIVFVLSYDAEAQAAASLAHRAGMTSGYAWLLPRSEVVPVPDLLGWLWVRPFLGSKVQAYAEQVSNYSRSHFDITVSPDSVDLEASVALHDAIMLYAYAATTVISNGGTIHDGEAVTAAVRNTSFTGVGGNRVVLNSDGDRIESYEVMNYVLGEGGVMSSVAVGVYSSTAKQYEAYDQAVKWPGKTMEVPADYFSGGHP